MNIEEFKKKLSSVNEIIYFDSDDNFREKSSDLSKLEQFIIDAEILLENSTNDKDRYFLRSILGNFYRIYGQPQKAISYFTNCLNDASENKDIKKEIVTLIRLGEAWKYDSNQNKALVIFNEALVKCREHNQNEYLDFALQHKGKCLLELGRLIEAEYCLLEALRLRQLKGDIFLIESTQQVITLIGKLKI